MAFKVFLSYSTNPDEQVLVWRLQTLAAAHGIQVYVPQRPGIPPPPSHRAILVEGVRNAIERCDCVLAIVTVRTGPYVEQELNYALTRRKLIIPIVEEGVGGASFFNRFPKTFWFSARQDPGQVEAQVIEFLRQQKLSKENLQALGALVGIGLGLLLLSALAKK